MQIYQLVFMKVFTIGSQLNLLMFQFLSKYSWYHIFYSLLIQWLTVNLDSNRVNDTDTENLNMSGENKHYKDFPSVFYNPLAIIYC